MQKAGGRGSQNPAEPFGYRRSHAGVKPRRGVGLMGGTFNPVHLGHLRAAEEFMEKLRLERVYFMPAAQPPHKAEGPLAAYEHRLKMLELAVADRPGFLTSDLETRLPQPSYTINTIKAFNAAWPHGTTVYFLVGLDSFLTLPKWHSFRELLLEMAFTVFGRAGLPETADDLCRMLQENIDPRFAWDQEREAFTAPGWRPVYFLPGGQLEISSTNLRQRLESGASVRYLLPEPVREYIEQNGLYSTRCHT